MQSPYPYTKPATSAASFGTMGSSRSDAPLPYATASREAPQPSRFALISRSGEYWSYPYAYVGLVECVSPDLVSIFCNCEHISKIELKGHGLDDVAVALNNQTLLAVTESDHADFRQKGVVIVEIKVERKSLAQKK